GTFTDLPFDFYFNEQLLSFKDLSISIDIRDFTEEEVNEIIEEKKLNNKGYIVEIGYGAEIHLDKVQFHEYYINNFFKMDVYVKGEILLKAGKVGYLFTLEKL